MGLETQGSKPTGLAGRIMGRMMNRFHTGLYIDYLCSRLPGDDSVILDIGCGGGELLRWLAEINKTYRLYGVDHSKEMVSMALKVNAAYIEEGRLEILNGQAGAIKLAGAGPDLVTAMETVQFWPDPAGSFTEIKGLLVEGGKFIIINRYPAEGTKWWRLASIKSEKEYLDMLTKAGFRKVNTDLSFRKGWIVVTATT